MARESVSAQVIKFPSERIVRTTAERTRLRGYFTEVSRAHPRESAGVCFRLAMSAAELGLILSRNAEPIGASVEQSPRSTLLDAFESKLVRLATQNGKAYDIDMRRKVNKIIETLAEATPICPGNTREGNGGKS